jgi:hypothetical protein
LAPTVGIAATGFCHPGGILQLFHRQDQQILRLPIATARRHRFRQGKVDGLVDRLENQIGSCVSSWRALKEKKRVLGKFGNFRQATSFLA